MDNYSKVERKIYSKHNVGEPTEVRLREVCGVVVSLVSSAFVDTFV